MGVFFFSRYNVRSFYYILRNKIEKRISELDRQSIYFFKKKLITLIR